MIKQQHCVQGMTHNNQPWPWVPQIIPTPSNIRPTFTLLSLSLTASFLEGPCPITDGYSEEVRKCISHSLLLLYRWEVKVHMVILLHTLPPYVSDKGMWRSQILLFSLALTSSPLNKNARWAVGFGSPHWPTWPSLSIEYWLSTYDTEWIRRNFCTVRDKKYRWVYGLGAPIFS